MPNFCTFDIPRRFGWGTVQTFDTPLNLSWGTVHYYRVDFNVQLDYALWEI